MKKKKTLKAKQTPVSATLASQKQRTIQLKPIRK